jgi:hypothetical protein
MAILFVAFAGPAFAQANVDQYGQSARGRLESLDEVLT